MIHRFEIITFMVNFIHAEVIPNNDLFFSRYFMLIKKSLDRSIVICNYCNSYAQQLYIYKGGSIGILYYFVGKKGDLFTTALLLALLHLS